MGYITAEGMYALDHYKYVSGGYSPFDNFMNPFWEFCVTLLPMVRRLQCAALLCIVPRRSTSILRYSSSSC